MQLLRYLCRFIEDALQPPHRRRLFQAGRTAGEAEIDLSVAHSLAEFMPAAVISSFFPDR
ncbi:hypothetical protein [Noviherbaspirillum soli]|uniref:hypothetical protein n=1 Tax=Noviherbaspirillum soli TaxID=1064518 RepID=UPI00188AC859|nr:hypothetical protein [Noviherbaspirillum soli]